MIYINRADLAVYVERCLPHENLADFDLDAIADDLIADYPEVIGEHNLIDDYPHAIDRVDEYLDETFNAEHFWQIVEAFDHDPGDTAWPKVVRRAGDSSASGVVAAPCT